MASAEDRVRLRAGLLSLAIGTALLGVKYQPEAGEGFSHSNVITLLNREGEIIHQRQGLKGGLDETAAALALAVQ